MPTTRYLAFQCPVCKDVIISRANHDFNTCSCGSEGIYVDGDSFYDPKNKYASWYRIGYSNDHGIPKGYYVDLPVTRQEMYQDWNTRTNKWAKIDVKLYPLIEISEINKDNQEVS